MKKSMIILGVLCLLFLTGCELETSDNGNLDGFWHLERVDTLATQQSVDYSQAHIFWSFQFKLLQLSDLENNTILYEFDTDGTHIVLVRPCMFDRSDGDTVVTDLKVLEPYGVNSTKEYLTIVSLDEERMVLKSAMLMLHFKKY